MTTAEFMLELAKQVPALAVLGLIVWKFLAHLAARDENQTNRDKVFAAALATLGDSCHEVQRESNQVMRDNTNALGEFSAAVAMMNRRGK